MVDTQVERAAEAAVNPDRILVAVYGSLRKGLGNHRLLEQANLLGTFTTPPVYSMYALGGYPGLKQNGETAVVMEVYEVTPAEATRVDNLEGYDPNSNNNTFYTKVMIDTPYGQAGTYIFVPPVMGRTLVEGGDWMKFVQEHYARR